MFQEISGKRIFLLGVAVFVSAVFLGLFPQNLFAVLKAEGGKAVMLSEPAQEKKTEPKEKQLTMTLTSRVPKAVRAFAKDTASATAQTGSTQTGTASTSATVASSAGNKTASSTSAAASAVKPSTTTPAATASSVAPASPAPVRSDTATPGKASDSLGCILAGTLRKDITSDECRMKGGRVILPSGASASAGGTVSVASPPATSPSTSPQSPAPSNPAAQKASGKV